MDQSVLKYKTTHTDVTETLVTWRHELGRDASCLARLIQSFGGGSATVVLSEIAENPDALGITSDFPGAATAAWPVLASQASRVDPKSLTWFAHHGPFSSYDPSGPETLTEVALSFDGMRLTGDLSGHRLLDPYASSKLLTSWQLKAVTDVLARLGSA
ncbi:hypothetical protein OG373_13745 [Streptomyces avidinii]|uniref:hypothetical protein n=1 Tax=Streptomyces avidinii TaxID=1895 RepID=UPI00386B6DE3|nr:hypothetical protein OG373_13745 [Streptomyces avidinii]